MLDAKAIKITGRVVKLSEVAEEWSKDIENTEKVKEYIKISRGKADIFTFIQRLPQSMPKFNYYMEWDSIAAIPITSYENWIKKQVAQNSRKKISYAQRKGVKIRKMEFNDETVRGILEIYHESPILQGKPNRQYNTNFETAKKLNATFLDKAQFIGAYYHDELIAYIKLVATEKFMRTMGILAKVAHRDKGAMNLLIAKAVEICSDMKIPYLTYAKFEYGKKGSQTLKDFKRNLGFESIILPRYYIPLNAWGKIVIKLTLHRDILEYLPKSIIARLLYLRNNWYTKKYSKELEAIKTKYIENN